MQIGIDHYAWKGSCQSLQKWFQGKLTNSGKYVKADVNTWNKIIQILKNYKQNEHAKMASTIKQFCQKMDYHKGTALAKDKNGKILQDVQHKTLPPMQKRIDQFVQINVEGKSCKQLQSIVNDLKKKQYVLFDQRFQGHPELLKFKNQKEMDAFKEQVRTFSEMSLTWIYYHNDIFLE